MSRISFVFATGESWLDRLVTIITRSRWSHVAIRFEAENILAEALVFRGLILEPGEKYDSWPVMQMISCEVDQLFYQKMLALSRVWGEKHIPYGYPTCIAIGIKSLLGLTAGKLALKILPGKAEATLVCSEMIVKLWRIGVPDFLAGHEPRLVSPDDLYYIFSRYKGEI